MTIVFLATLLRTAVVTCSRENFFHVTTMLYIADEEEVERLFSRSVRCRREYCRVVLIDKKLDKYSIDEKRERERILPEESANFSSLSRLTSTYVFDDS